MIINMKCIVLCSNSYSHPILRTDIEFKLCIDSAYLFTVLIAELRSIENKSRRSNRKQSLASVECIWLWRPGVKAPLKIKSRVG